MKNYDEGILLAKGIQGGKIPVVDLPETPNGTGRKRRSKRKRGIERKRRRKRKRRKRKRRIINESKK